MKSHKVRVAAEANALLCEALVKLEMESRVSLRKIGKIKHGYTKRRRKAEVWSMWDYG